MRPKKFIRRLSEAKALQWTGASEDLKHVKALVGGNVLLKYGKLDGVLEIETVDDYRVVQPGFWIVRDTEDEVRVYHPGLFGKVYKPADGEELEDHCPKCEAPLDASASGGVTCTKCDYWFCY